jgi:hypothetical protein
MKYGKIVVKCLLWHLMALNVSFMAGCTTTQPRTVADEIILERVYCGLTDIGKGEDGDISYAYDPNVKEDGRNRMDTKETVDQIIVHNAIRERICSQKVELNNES